jgi:hypothetical protein
MLVNAIYTVKILAGVKCVRNNKCDAKILDMQEKSKLFCRKCSCTSMLMIVNTLPVDP